jgi:hypothetical protein
MNKMYRVEKGSQVKYFSDFITALNTFDNLKGSKKTSVKLFKNETLIMIKNTPSNISLVEIKGE